MAVCRFSPDSIPSSETVEREIKRIRYRRNFLSMLFNTIWSLMVVAAAAVLISVLFLPVLRVTGSSMSPTLKNDELVVCLKKSDYKCGDVVAFYYNNKILLKRVIGFSGDFIKITEDGTVYVNDEMIDEPYVTDKALGECNIDFPYQVPEQRVFVMGDHRSVSVDSRTTVVGCIADEAVLGKVFLRIWPFNSIGSDFDGEDNNKDNNTDNIKDSNIDYYQR